MALPADAQEPGAGLGDWGRASRRARLPALLPSLEVGPGSTGVVDGVLGTLGAKDPVLEGVPEQVADRVLHLTGSAQDVLEVTLGEDLAPSGPDTVQGLGHADQQSLHPAR